MTRPPMLCTELREAAPELALGLLTGQERAAALVHLEGCAACRAEVAALAGAADDILLTAPEATPPVGFAERVVARLADERRAETAVPVASAPSVGPAVGRRGRRRGQPRGWGRRRLGLAAVGAVAAALVVVAAVLVSGDDGPSNDLADATADMRTGVGEVVGTVTVRDDTPAVVVVDVPGWDDLDPPRAAGYWLAVELDDGSRQLTAITGDHSWWEVGVNADAGEVASVALLDQRGRAWCSARFA